MAQKREKIVLTASVRPSVGKGPASAVRREGMVPAVVYKEGESALSIQVPQRDLLRALHTKAGENVLITLQFGDDSKSALKGHKELTAGEGVVLIKELQHHPVSRQVIHIDFHQISLTKKITISVPLAFKGESLGVKQQGGVLEHLRWELEVECLPTEIPSEIPVDISGLEKGKSIAVRDITIPEGVRVITDADQPLVACVEPKAEELPTAPTEEAAAATEPEVIKQKKPEEEAAGAEAGEKAKEKPEKTEKAKA
ncbi:MAG: 50S ribosomal protein L25 [Candidatus Omnitrophica bacterium]|nr:50S ribosomal protein L25 [Candidatus Omnitrophota bacterium]